jgi:hypothetical protein
VLDRSERLGRWARHSDQIAFGLAVAELGFPVRTLGPEMNFPTHLEYADRREADIADPRVLHYHRLDSAGRIRPTGLPGVDAAIGRTNRLLDALATRRLSRVALGAAG